MKAKIIISAILTATIMNMSISALAIDSGDISGYVADVSKEYANRDSGNFFKDAIDINTGESLYGEFDLDKIVPWCDFGGYSLSADLEKNNFKFSRLSDYFTMPFERVFISSTDGGKTYSVDWDMEKMECFEYSKVKAIFDYDSLAATLSNVGVNIIKQMTVFSTNAQYDINSLYFDTDKGEFVIPIRDFEFKTRDGRKVGVSKDNIYTAKEYAEFIGEFKNSTQVDTFHEGAVQATEDGEVYVTTPNPTTTPKPTITPNPNATDKQIETSQPTATPKSTEKPSETALQQSPATPAPTAKLTLTSTDGQIEITSNGITVEFPDAKPFIDENDRTLVPVRAVSESLGLTVCWEEETGTVSIGPGYGYGGRSVFFVIGENRYRINGDYFDMDTAAVIIDERTYVPVRYVAEAMGMTVVWE